MLKYKVLAYGVLSTSLYAMNHKDSENIASGQRKGQPVMVYDFNKHTQKFELSNRHYCAHYGEDGCSYSVSSDGKAIDLERVISFEGLDAHQVKKPVDFIFKMIEEKKITHGHIGLVLSVEQAEDFVRMIGEICNKQKMGVEGH